VKERTRTTGQFSCRDCGRQWNATSEVHCAVCHHHFSGYTTYDLHLADGQHRDPGEITHGETFEPLLVGLRTLLGTIRQGSQCQDTSGSRAS
jgi:hypothetical protein